MPITEIVIPRIRQDAMEEFAAGPRVSIQKVIAAAPGIRTKRTGRIITEKTVPVPQDSVRPILGMTWSKLQDFQNFIGSQEFKDVAGSMKSMAIGPPEIQVFDTDINAEVVYSSPLTEIYRIKVSEARERGVQKAWDNLVSVMKVKNGDMPSISGLSLNLEEKTFLGIIGWEGTEARDDIHSKRNVVEARAAIEDLGGVESFTAQFRPF